MAIRSRWCPPNDATRCSDASRAAKAANRPGSVHLTSGLVLRFQPSSMRIVSSSRTSVCDGTSNGRRAQIERRIERLVDAYQAEALTLEELQARRSRLESRRAELVRDEQVLRAESVQRDHLQSLATRVEDFRAAISDGLEYADFTQRRALVELLIDRVVV